MIGNCTSFLDLPNLEDLLFSRSLQQAIGLQSKVLLTVLDAIFNLRINYIKKLLSILNLAGF